MDTRRLPDIKAARRFMKFTISTIFVCLALIFLVYGFGVFDLRISSVCSGSYGIISVFTAYGTYFHPMKLLKDEAFLQNLQCAPKKIKDISSLCSVFQAVMFEVWFLLIFNITEYNFFKVSVFCGIFIIHLIINVYYLYFFSKACPEA